MKARLLAFLADARPKALALRSLLACLAYGHVKRDDQPDTSCPGYWSKYDERKPEMPITQELALHCCDRCGLCFWEKVP